MGYDHTISWDISGAAREETEQYFDTDKQSALAAPNIVHRSRSNEPAAVPVAVGAAVVVWGGVVVEAIVVVGAAVVMGAAVVVEAIVVVATVVAVGSKVVVTGGGGVHTQLKLDGYKPCPALHNSYVPNPSQERS